MNAPVVTITLNPALDLTVAIETLCRGEVHRASAAMTNAGGKGVNVASCLADWGLPVTATGFLGAGNTSAFSQLCDTKDILDRFIRVQGETRTNIKIAETVGGETTDINLPGFTVNDKDLNTLLEELDKIIVPDSFVVIAGSLPAGMAPDSLPPLVARLRQKGTRVIVDTSGAPLTAVLSAPPHALPFCVKPNRRELEAWIGHPLPDRAVLIDAAQALHARGIAMVVVSLGAEGAIFVSDQGLIHGYHPPVPAISTVGAGDAMVAGLVAGFVGQMPLQDLIRLSVAFPAAKLARVGPHLPDRAVILDLAAHVTLTTDLKTEKDTGGNP